MEETGLVIEVENNSFLKVRVKRTEACAKCRTCIMGLTQQDMVITTKNDCGAKVGDSVKIELKSGSFLFAVLMMYAVPLLMLLAGFAAGYFITSALRTGSEEIVSFAVGIFLMAGSYFLISKLNLKTEKPVATQLIE